MLSLNSEEAQEGMKMARQFTAAEIAEAKWYTRKALSIREDIRCETRRRASSEEEVLARVPEEIKARFLQARALHAEGAYRP